MNDRDLCLEETLATTRLSALNILLPFDALCCRTGTAITKASCAKPTDRVKPSFVIFNIHPL